MNIVSEIWTWEEGGRLYSRLTTNVCAKRLLKRLVEVELQRDVETIHAYFGDRADGGNGYELLWKRSVTWDHLRDLLPKM